MASTSKHLTREQYAAELASLAGHLKGNNELGGFQRFWETPNDHQRWTMSDAFWDIVKQLPPLVAAAQEFRKPDGSGKWIWKIVSPELMESIFGEEADRLAAGLNELITVDWSTRFTHRDRQFQEIEARMLAYRRYREFVAGLEAAGVTQYRTALTDHGLSARQLEALEEYIAGKSGEIGKARGPGPRAPLFEAPKTGRYPRFDDTQYSQYLRELWAKYGDVLERMTGSGISLNETQVEKMMEQLDDFDYARISGTLGAQKRWPPQDEHGLNAKVYELLATLPQAFGRAFEENTAKHVRQSIQDSLPLLESSEASTRSWAFDTLRHLKNLLRWLSQKIPIDSQAFVDARTAIAREFDPRWAAISAGPLHEKYMGQIRFSGSNALPLTDEWPQTLNPAKDFIYAHVFLDKAIQDVATANMLWVEAGAQRYQFDVQKLPGDSAYLCVSVLPENGRNPDLVRTLGKALLAAATGELEFVVTPHVDRSAVGLLKIEMTTADAARLPARIEELAARAEANRTAAAVVPHAFTRAQKWPYKDVVLTPEKVRQAIETAWEHDRGDKIEVLHMRVNHYRPGYEWDLEVGPLQVPVARLAFSYIGIVFGHAGKVFAVEDGIQVRQFWKGHGQGYGDDLNVLFWGAKPFELPPEQVRRIVG